MRRYDALSIGSRQKSFFWYLINIGENDEDGEMKSKATEELEQRKRMNLAWRRSRESRGKEKKRGKD